MASAWESANRCNKLKWVIFVPSFVAVFIFLVELIWQTYLYLSEFGVIKNTLTLEQISGIFSFLVSNNMLGWFVFGIVFLILFVFIFPSWLRGVLIKTLYERATKPEKQTKIRKNVLAGLDYFFPLFELHAIGSLFSAWSILIVSATLYRYFDDALFLVLKPVLILYFILALVFTFFIVFAPYFIVCRGESVSVGIRKSIQMVFMNLKSTLMMFGLMFLVNLRVLFNVVLILGIPIFVMAAFSYWTLSVALTASVVFSLFMLCFVSYLTAILEIFSTAFWVNSFLALEDNEKKTD